MTDIRAEHNRPIFIFYTRRDGRDLAPDLRTRLEEQGFTSWQDVIAMEGGANRWLTVYVLNGNPNCH